MALSGGTPHPEAWFREACAGRGLAVDVEPRVGLVGWWLPDASPRAAVPGGSSPGRGYHVVVGGGDQRGVTEVLETVDRLRERGWSPHRPVAVVGPGSSPGGRELLLRLVPAAGGPDPSPPAQLEAHGLFRLEITGRPVAAGSPMEGRRDPMLTYAMTVLAAAKQARLAGARATTGRVQVEPNRPEVVASRVTGWLDVRAGSVEGVLTLAAAVERLGLERSLRDGTGLSVSTEHVTARVGAAVAREVLALLAGPDVGLGA